MSHIVLRRLILGIALSAGIFVTSTCASADPGKPVAVRWWGHAMVTIETSWNLRIVIDPYGLDIGYDNPEVRGDLVLITHNHRDHNNPSLVEGDPVVVRGLSEDGNVRPVHHVLDRMPNTPKPTWRDAKLRIARSAHAVVVTNVRAWHDNRQGSQRGANALFLIEVDGLRIVHCGDLGQHELNADQLTALGDVDLLLIPVGGVYTVDGDQAAGIVRQLNPRVVMPIHYKTADLTIGLETEQKFLKAMGDDAEVIRPVGNTVALRSVEEQESSGSVIVLPKYRPWEMPDKWAGLFDRKEAASRNSQKVFAELSAKQMNFRPSNGTHTPRWNTEHMMGRELLFFTQIFAQVDPTISVIDLNPKQMPPDYVAAHPDWTGEEEARQMERVTAFVRRFAYLLDGLDLDAKAAGSRWTPRGLLEQMDRHYSEHTANVKKKFELEDFPQE